MNELVDEIAQKDASAKKSGIHAQEQHASNPETHRDETAICNFWEALRSNPSLNGGLSAPWKRGFSLHQVTIPMVHAVLDKRPGKAASQNSLAQSSINSMNSCLKVCALLRASRSAPHPLKRLSRIVRYKLSGWKRTESCLSSFSM